jgi:hypothetical protein
VSIVFLLAAVPTFIALVLIAQRWSILAAGCAILILAALI